MNSFQINVFYTLLKREMWEHRLLFVGAPLVLALLILVAILWIALQPGAGFLADALRQADLAFEGLPVLQLAPFLFWAGLPFIILLYVCCIIYLLSTLYQDRKDSSIFFWQSMPVSNCTTVMSKVVTVCAVAPLATVFVLFILFCLAAMLIAVFGVAWDLEYVSYWRAVAASLVTLMLIYLSAVMSSLWLLPTIGWFLLFSAFARSVPLLWAIGAAVLIGFLEDMIFSTQYLGNWVQSRSNFNQYILFEFQEIPAKVFNYDMMIGIALGSLLIAGATYMRRFID
ncbi:MAG: hypothetical protein WDZ76_09935 [Pseudohongiellaceae bacterium]